VRNTFHGSCDEQFYARDFQIDKRHPFLIVSQHLFSERHCLYVARD
jgi:hypothetical protein